MGVRLGMAAHDRLLAVTPISFDIAALEIFCPGFRRLRDTGVACRSERWRPTWRTPPPGVRHDAAGYPCDVAAASGRGRKRCRRVDLSLRRRGFAGRPGRGLCRNSARLWNLYGPTETTIWSAAHLVESVDGQPPIGRPIANTHLYVLDAGGEPAPIGVPGGVVHWRCRPGAQIPGRPALTADRFVPILSLRTLAPAGIAAATWRAGCRAARLSSLAGSITR